MKMFRFVSISLACLVLAAFSVTVTSAHMDSPALAALGAPENGHQMVESALRQYRMNAQLAISNGDVPKIDPQTILLARSGIRKEPLAIDGYFLLNAEGNEPQSADGAIKAMRLASALSTRNLMVNAWLLDHFAKSDNTQMSLEYTDRLIRVNRDIAAVLVATMAKALEDRKAMPLLLTKLEKKPPWDRQFWWATVKSSDEVIKNASQLRISAYRKKLLVPDGFDESLLSELIRRGHFDEGSRLASVISAAEKSASGNLVRNGDFRGTPLLPPLGWRVSSDISIGGYIDRENGTLEISAAPDAEGIVAEQVLQVPQNSYVMTVSLERDGASTEGDIQIAMSCVPGYGSAERWVMTPRNDKSSAAFENAGECSVYRLAVETVPGGNSKGFDVTISGIRLLPVERRGQPKES